MRSLVVPLLLALVGCSDPEAQQPAPASPAPSSSVTPSPPATPEEIYALVLPGQTSSFHAFTTFAHLQDGQASEESEFEYGLSEKYPTSVILHVDGGYLLKSGCELTPGTVEWTSILETQGTAATLALLGTTSMAVNLKEEGNVSVLLQGVVHATSCPGSTGESIFPLRHRVTLHVHRVARFEVEQFNQHGFDCQENLVLPSGGLALLPAVHAKNSAGQRFAPVNAPRPASITMRSHGELAQSDDGSWFSAAPGEVTLTVGTTLPVEGLRSITVVGPETLVEAKASFVLDRVAAKGKAPVLIEEGGSYELFFPGPENTVMLRVEGAVTSQGKLCNNVPESWVSARSFTPERCAAQEIKTDPTDRVPVAVVLSGGECQVEARLIGTDRVWSTRFSTTP